MYFTGDEYRWLVAISEEEKFTRGLHFFGASVASEEFFFADSGDGIGAIVAGNEGIVLFRHGK